MATKLKMLCLHGVYSNNDITAMQTVGLKLGDKVECVYLHAPHVTRGCYPGVDAFSGGPWYAWCDPTKSLEEQEDQWEESLEYIAKYCKENGPFEGGVYGFSQGASIITNFSHPEIWKDKFKLKRCPWKFAILACGGSSHNITIPRGTIIDMPSFAIFGKKDRHLNDGKIISQYWEPSKRVSHTHGRGHEIDMQMFAREKEMMAKLNHFLDEHCGSKKGPFGIVG